MDINKEIDRLDVEITDLISDFSIEHFLPNVGDDELEIIVAKAIKFGMLVAERDSAQAQAVPEWIETAIQPPEEGQKVIISGIYGVGIAEFSYLYKDEFVMYDMGASNPILSKDQVKFWQPLPNAPQEPSND